MSIEYRHIACCVDESDAADRALAHARAIQDLAGGRLSVVHVIAPPAFLVSMAASLGGAPVHDPQAEREAARMWLDERVRATGGDAVLLEGHPPSTAAEWGRDAGCDLLIAASHRGLVERALLGSFASYLAHHAPCPVLLVPPAPAEDGS